MVSPVAAEDIIFSGTVDGNGNGYRGVTDGNLTVQSIFIQAHGKPNLYDREWYQSYTTECIVKNGGKLTAFKDVHIVNTSQNGGGRNEIDNNGGLYATNGASVSFVGAESVYIASIGGTEGFNDSTAITAKQTFLNGDTDKVNSVEIRDVKGSVQIIGSLDVSPSLFQFGPGAHNTIVIELSGSNSFWYGDAIGQDNGAVVDITLGDGAKWIFSAGGNGDDGRLDHLTLNKGVVILADDVAWETYRNTLIPSKDENDPTKDKNYVLADYRDSDARHCWVDIANLNGTGGTFVIDLDWQSNQGQKTHAKDGTSDFIEVGNVQDGSVQNIVFDTSKAHLGDMNIGDKLYFASVEHGETTFSTNADGEYNSASELYTFNFETMKEWSEEDSLTYWYLTKSLGKTNENVTLLKDATLVSYSLATDLDRFHERRGEARYANGTSDGLWVRYRFSNIGFDNAFDMDKNMFQIGFDRDVSTSGSRKIVGVAFDYTQANTDLIGFTGSGDNERYGLNFYYTLLADCGGYADFTAKIGRIGNDYGAQNSNGANIGADFWQTYYGIGAEFGYKYEFKSNVFIEPQAQLQIVHIEDASFTSNSGIEADIDNMNSIIGRLGFRAGYSFDSVAENQKNTVYLLADVMHEFDGDSNIYAIGASMPYSDESSGSDTWYDVGIGTNLMLSNNSKLWLDTKHIFGGIYNSSWQINAGINITF